MHLHPTRLHAVALAVLSQLALTAHAARPLSVDDTGTNEVGAGHVEAWIARADGVNTLNLSPAFAVAEGFELVGTLSREQSSHRQGATLQFRWMLTEAPERGCNFATSGGHTRFSDGGGRQSFVYAMMTCSFGGAGTTHTNLGLIRPGGEGSHRFWGVAYERALGPVTPHLEFFGEKGSKPTVQVGARGEVARGVQLDGTVGRNDGATLYTLGVKFQF